MFPTLKVENGFYIWHLGRYQNTFKLIELKYLRENKLITSIYDVKTFQTKLRQWNCQRKNGNLVHFKTCKSVSVQSK
jgi:hypothetical protein